MEWISVEDRLPKKKGEYVIYTYTAWMGVKYFSSSQKLFLTGSSCGNSHITHWAFLPDPPKEVQGNG